MDLSNLDPAIKKNVAIPLVDKEGITARLVEKPEAVIKKENEEKIQNIFIDATTRATAQIRLEACENGVTIDAVYNERLHTLISNEALDKRAFETAKAILDQAHLVAKEMGVPDKEDADTIFLLSKVATGELNAREHIAEVRAVHKKNAASGLSPKDRKKRKKKNKEARAKRRKSR